MDINIKLLSGFRDLFTEDEEAKKSRKSEVGYMNNTNIFMLVTKDIAVINSMHGKKRADKIPDLDYKDKKDKAIVSVSSEYFLQIADFIKSTGCEKIKILAGTDFPITFELPEINTKVILAPRIEHND